MRGTILFTKVCYHNLQLKRKLELLQSKFYSVLKYAIDMLFIFCINNEYV